MSTHIRWHIYDAENVEHHTFEQSPEQWPEIQKGRVLWLDVVGLNAEMMKQLKEQYSIHHLIAEDMLNTRQRPKFERYESSEFITIKMLQKERDSSFEEHEQLSIFFREGLVLTVQEKPGDVFASVRERIEENKGRIRKREEDYLVYALLDCVIDEYLQFADILENRSEQLEAQLLRDEDNDIKNCYAFRNELHRFKRMSRATIDMLKRLMEHIQEDEHTRFQGTTKVYLRDVHDHAMSFSQNIEELQEQCNSLIELYYAQINDGMGRVMKVLAVISTIFLPLNLLAAVYGMNFTHMPELKYKWGYYILLGTMGFIVASMLSLFKYKKWF